MVVFVAIVLAYLPAIQGTLLWDDDAHVTPPGLRSWDGLWRIWFEPGASQQFYPVLHTAFWVEHRLWGDATLGYHLVNLLLHATAACLVVVLVRRLIVRGGGERGGSGLSDAPAALPRDTGGSGPVFARYPGVEWLAGLIFALHPVEVESVAWISEQKNTLSAVFYLAAALSYLSFDRTRRAARYWQATGLFVLALLSKTVTATLPAALLVILWWQRGKLNGRRDVAPLLPWFGLGICGGLMTAWVEHTFFVAVQIGNGAPGAAYTLSLLERVLLAGRIIWFYIGKLAWPAELTFSYPSWNVSAQDAWQYLPLLGIVVVLIVLLRIARRQRGPLAGFLVFSGTLFPALGFINIYPFIYSYVADHFQYLASLGLIVPFAVAFSHATSLATTAGGAWRWLGRAAPAALLLLLATLTWQQSRMYRDVETLYRTTLERNPASWMAHSNLGLILAQDSAKLPEALVHFEAAVRLKPVHPEVHNYLGSALARIPGRKAEAIAAFETALRLSPRFPFAHVNLAVALMDLPTRMPEALAHFETALRLKPDWAEAHQRFGNALLKVPGRERDGIDQLETALRLNPALVDAHTQLAIAFSGMPGRAADALRHFEFATRLAPESAEAHFNFGYALAETPGRLTDALAQFETAVRLDPLSVDARFALAATLANLPDRQAEALSHFERVLQLKPDHDGAQQWVQALRKPPR